MNTCCYKIDLCGGGEGPNLWFRNGTEAVSKRPSGMLEPLLTDIISFMPFKSVSAKEVLHGNDLAKLHLNTQKVVAYAW